MSARFASLAALVTALTCCAAEVTPSHVRIVSGRKSAPLSVLETGRKDTIYDAAAFNGAWTQLPKFLQPAVFHPLRDRLTKGDKIAMTCKGPCTCTFHVVMYHCSACGDNTGGMFEANTRLGWERRSCGPKFVTGSAKQPTVVFRKDAEPGETIVTAAAASTTTGLGGVFVSTCQHFRHWCTAHQSSSEEQCSANCAQAKRFDF
eukprot:Rhum_TRINITY_DN3554_c0_g1::Rhum_TRINITY_DN3554_c0_g1_i1::g.11205::m.11205